MSGVERIAAERKRQIDAEGWTEEHDDFSHWDESLACSAAAYALPASERVRVPHHEPRYGGNGAPRFFPGDWDWKPTPDDRIRELEKAGALIAAEIDRLLRAEAK